MIFWKLFTPELCLGLSLSLMNIFVIRHGDKMSSELGESAVKGSDGHTNILDLV